MTREQILLIAVLVLVPLLNFLVRRARRHLEGQARPGVEPEPAKTVPPARTVPARLVGKRGEPRDIRPISRLIPTTLPPERRRRPWLRVLSRSDARRGFVLMTVLGPCRGLSPLEPGGGRSGGAVERRIDVRRTR